MIPKCKNASVQSIRREVDWSWFAGILDGEGNLSASTKIAPNGKAYFQSKIRVANTDVRMIERISKLYVEEGIVFFYSIHPQRGKNGARYKTQMNIEVCSQGSSRKVLERVIPYLANKKATAETLLDLISFVQGMPKGGNTLAIDYVHDPIFVNLMKKFKEEASWYVDPSEITRCAGKKLFLPDDMIRTARRRAEVGRNVRPAA